MYERHRFSPEIIHYAVWLYHRFNRSHRDIEDLLAERGIIVSYESIRLWRNKFGLKYVHGGSVVGARIDKSRVIGKEL